MTMLECIQVSKEFVVHMRGGKVVQGFSNVSFSVAEGEFLGISGPSGIGKSSLLKCIYRTYRPTEGEILFTTGEGDAINLATADDYTVLNLRRQEIGYVSQFFKVIPRVSALETIIQALISRGIERKEGTQLARDTLHRLHIPEGLWDLFPSTFSGGEKQRINIIHAMAGRPRLLLLDEPTASLDPRSAIEVIGLIEELKNEGTAIIGIFHDKATLDQLSDRQLHFAAHDRSEVVTPTGASAGGAA